jgi:acyl-CoA synthetase (AMP-forming)/AMP-acid ligase II
MQGYYRNPEATARTLVDGWLRTGDMGFVADGALHVTGRLKDLIIRHGRNHYPQDIEGLAERHESVRKGCVIAFSHVPPGAQAEEVYVLAEARTTEPADRPAIAEAIGRAVHEHQGFRPEKVEVLPPHTLLKTSSGKLRRKPTQAAYLAGTLLGRRNDVLDKVKTVTASRLHWGARQVRSWLRPN